MKFYIAMLLTTVLSACGFPRYVEPAGEQTAILIIDNQHDANAGLNIFESGELCTNLMVAEYTPIRQRKRYVVHAEKELAFSVGSQLPKNANTICWITVSFMPKARESYQAVYSFTESTNYCNLSVNRVMEDGKLQRIKVRKRERPSGIRWTRDQPHCLP